MPRLRFFVALGLLLATIVLSLGHLALGSVHRRVAASVARDATAELAHRDFTGDGRRRDPSCGDLGPMFQGHTCLRSPERPAAALRHLRSVLPGSAMWWDKSAIPGGRPGACSYEAEVAGGPVVVMAFPHLEVSSTPQEPSGAPAAGRMPHPAGSVISVEAVDRLAH